MGAMARQVLQVKRKNSTSCSWPEARFTVVGSVACRSGPREVVITWISTGAVAAKTGFVACGPAEVSVAVALRVASAGVSACSDETLVAAGAQEDAAKTAIRLRVQKMKRGRRGLLGKKSVYVTHRFIHLLLPFIQFLGRENPDS